MDEIIAFCGINCAKCPVFLATQANDDTKRIKTAKQWSQAYEKHKDLKPEEINCDGCLAKNSILFKSCRVCPVRECGIEKKVVNCAYCESYPCQKLDEAPYGKASLEEIRKRL